MLNQHTAPGPKGNILLGNMREFQRDPLKFLLDAVATYGDIVRFRLGSHRVYLVNSPDTIHEVLVTQAQKIKKTDFNKKLLGKFLGNGLVTSDGDFHRRQRRMMQPAFHHRHIAQYADVMVNHTLHMLDRWQPGQSYNIDGEMMRLTLSIVSDTLFGADVSKASRRVGQAIATLQGITVAEFKAGFMLPEWIPAPRNRRRRAATRVLHDTLAQIIRQRRASEAVKPDFLSMLLQAQDEDDGSSMTDEQVRDEAVTLFAAGHETTSNALVWTWYLLAQYPAVEKKLYEELSLVLAGRPPTFDDLAKLRYTEMVIKEAMRLYPPVWLLMSRAPEETITIGGYQIRPGDWIFVSPYVRHHRPEYFEDPENFDPERFTPEREAMLPRYAYFPFGGGSRVCIGNGFAMMEARLILATIAQRYKLTLDSGQEIVPEPAITLTTQNGIRMAVTTREAL